MVELKALCISLGFTNVSTYIASGNVIFASKSREADIKARLEAALEGHMGKIVGVMVRTHNEMAAVLAANPFGGAAPNRTMAIFLDEPPPADTLDRLCHVTDEAVALGSREIYVHYPRGMADSKLQIPAARTGTARNLNTVAKLVELAAKLSAM